MQYAKAMATLSASFLHSVAECLSLPADTFDRFIGNMSRLKMVKYPPAKPGSQGVGPHKDSLSLFTFLSQDHIGGLQVLNKAGQWIDAAPIEGSLIVNIAQGFEAVTGGLCSATTHRVQVRTLYSAYHSSTNILNILCSLLPLQRAIAYHSSRRSDSTLPMMISRPLLLRSWTKYLPTTIARSMSLMCRAI